MYYIYRHIRLDTNEPFYIGIGKNVNYKRAYSKNRRNKMWYNIINKTQYEIEVLIDDITKLEAFAKEREFIALYGRKDLNTGILVNMTDGGDGNMNPSKECRDKISKVMKGKKKNREHIKKVVESKQCPINQLDIYGNIIKTWNSVKIAQDTLNIFNVSKCCKGEIKQTKGFRFEYAQKNKPMKLS